MTTKVKLTKTALLACFCLGNLFASDAPTISQQEQDYARDNLSAEKMQASSLKVTAQELKLRGGCPNFFSRMAKEKSLTVAYFGGSITNHNGWRPQTFAELQKMSESCKLKMVNAAIGGTGSIVGVFRADDELIAHKPDLVFIEFAVNDGGDAVKRTKDVMRALEGIILKIKKANPLTDICMVYTLQTANLEVVKSGFCHPAAAVHEQVATAYNLPSIYVGPAIVQAIDQGKAVMFGKVTDKAQGTEANGKLVITEDNTHPVLPTGHAFYAEIVLRSLKILQTEATKSGSQEQKLPKPLFGSTWEKAKTLQVQGNATFKGTWNELKKDNGPKCFRYGDKIYDRFPCLMSTKTPGSSVTVKYKGTLIGLKGMKGPNSGILDIAVDGKKQKPENQFTAYNTRFFYEGAPLDEMKDGEHEVVWSLSAEAPDKGKILASYYKPNNDADLKAHPEKYKENSFSVGELIMIGDVIPVK